MVLDLSDLNTSATFNLPSKATTCIRLQSNFRVKSEGLVDEKGLKGDL